MSTSITTQPPNRTNIVPNAYKTTIKSLSNNKTVVTHSALVRNKGDSADLLNIIAEMNINANTLVAVGVNGGVVLANPNMQNFVIGLSVRAVSVGGQCEIITSGKVSNSGWNLIPNKEIYLGVDGEITHDPYSGIYTICVGRSLSPTSIILQIQLPIVRSL
jgi:hypothetical protein